MPAHPVVRVHRVAQDTVLRCLWTYSKRENGILALSMSNPR